MEYTTINDWLKENQRLKLLVKTRPNLRTNEMTIYVGFGFLQNLYDTEKDLTETDRILLEYPERWLNIIEQRALYNMIFERCPNVEEIMILTHSVYIIQCTPAQCCFIIDVDERDKYKENYPFDKTNRMSPENDVMNLLGYQHGKLNVFQMKS